MREALLHALLLCCGIVSADGVAALSTSPPAPISIPQQESQPCCNQFQRQPYGQFQRQSNDAFDVYNAHVRLIPICGLHVSIRPCQQLIPTTAPQRTIQSTARNAPTSNPSMHPQSTSPPVTRLASTPAQQSPTPSSPQLTTPPSPQLTTTSSPQSNSIPTPFRPPKMPGNNKLDPSALQWQLAYYHDEDGNTLAGWKYSLVSAVLSGARVRVVIGSSYITEADNVHVHDDHVFAQLLQHVSKASWNKFKDSAYYWWVIASTNGVLQMTRYNVGSNKHRGSTTKKSKLKWFVKTSAFLSKPSYSHLANGSRVQGSLHDLTSGVQGGQEIRCVSGKTYSFLLQNVQITYDKKGTENVFGQNVDHISVNHANNLVQFQSNAYWWFIFVTTRGSRVTSRWTVGIHQSRGHTEDTVDIEWFADSCWKEVFSHGAKGKRLSGSRQSLASALLFGHRVRFQIPAWNYYTAEADSLYVKNGHVTAQALKRVSTKGLRGASWFWLMVSTTGTVRITMYNVGENKRRDDSTRRLKVKWFVDTRQWEQALSNDRFGHVLNGNRSSLVQSVRAGAEVRCIIGNKVRGYAYQAQNVAVSPDGNHVAAQALNQVSMRSAHNGKEMKIKRKAYWWFTIVSTTGSRDISRWTIGKHKSPGHSSGRIGQKWFVNH